jgi:predicted metal-dependent HD superfamily phosphohydrolase
MPGYDTCLVEAELRARSAYAEPHRRYHTERHLDDCLRQLEQVLDLMAQERRMLRWAILWHDAVYDPARRDNEERSADLACRELTACGVDEDTSGEVRRLILLTKGHRADESDRLGALLVSIDLSILGSDEARYREYVSGVRQEYAHVPEDAWRTGRAAVLRHLLDADPLYPDPTFRDRLVEQELKALGAG